MSLLLVLNELSYREAKARVDEVSASLHALVELLRRIRRHRADVALVTEAGFLDLVLADGYSVREWAGDGRNRDALRFLLGMRNRAPFRDVIPDGLGFEAEYFHEGRLAGGLGTAHLLGGLAMSLRLAAVWEAAWLKAVRRSLVENDEGDVVFASAEVGVRHACVPEHVDAHREWMVDSELTRIHTGAALWEAREDLFPHLRFLPRVAEDLDGLRAGWFNPVKERLAELERTAADWRQAGSAVPRWRSLVTPDSDSRKKFCYFVDVDGDRYLFDWHARFTPGAGRVHFRLDSASRALVIAYIGAKLV